MVVAPKCRICDNGKMISWSKLWGCCGPNCLRNAYGKSFFLYHCAKHRGPTKPGEPSLCIECYKIKQEPEK